MPYKFQFNVRDPEPWVFEAPLESRKCPANTIKKQRCQNQASIPYEYCWIHLRQIMHLRVKKSTIPNAGLGLFADDPTKEAGEVVFYPKQGKHSEIANYDGEIISNQECINRYGEETAPYGYGVSYKRKNGERVDFVIDAALKRTVASIANHKAVSKENAHLTTRPNGAGVYLRADKKIKNGSEIFASYGNDFWKTGPPAKYKTYYSRNKK